MSDQQRYSHNRPTSSDAEQSRPLWHYYVGITALLLVMVLALTGGIIWYNSKKTNQLAIAAAERMMLEAGEDVSTASSCSMTRCMRLSGLHPWYRN